MKQEYNFSETLKDLMIEHSKKLTVLAEDTKISYRSLRNYLNNVYNPSLINAIKLADYFKCSIDYLVGLTDIRNNKTYSTPDMMFYKRYRKLLIDRNKSHYRLTKDLNININDSRRWKSGSIPSLNTLIVIADYLGSSIDYLIGRKPIN